MRFFLPFVAGAALMLSSVTAGAQAYRADNRLVVTPVGGGSFSVPLGSRFGARGTWCAAADYAARVLGAAGTTRIYVQQPLARPGKTVVFGTDPGGASPQQVLGVTSALRTAGSNLSVDHAIQFCADTRLIRNR